MERLDAPAERGFGWDGVETSSWSALRRNGSPSPIWPRMTEERCAPLETQVASRGTDGSNPTSSSGESCKPIILVQLGDSRLRAVISSGKAQHLDAQVGILGNQLAVCDLGMYGTSCHSCICNSTQ